ncbi:MAG TPA: TIGR00159 family protein, partial [Firmicutes bacterium]|nr:TIGR00159 family protein [Bacillota bacterium]
MLEQLVQSIANFRLGFRDIIDITIVSYVLYRLILLIRGTRAEQLV